MHDGMPYGRIQGQGQGHESIRGSRIENLQSREVDRQSPTGLIFPSCFLRLFFWVCLCGWYPMQHMEDSKVADHEPDGRTRLPRIWRNRVGCVYCSVFVAMTNSKWKTYEHSKEITARCYLMMMTGKTPF